MVMKKIIGTMFILVSILTACESRDETIRKASGFTDTEQQYMFCGIFIIDSMTDAFSYTTYGTPSASRKMKMEKGFGYLTNLETSYQNIFDKNMRKTSGKIQNKITEIVYNCRKNVASCQKAFDACKKWMGKDITSDPLPNKVPEMK